MLFVSSSGRRPSLSLRWTWAARRPVHMTADFFTSIQQSGGSAHQRPPADTASTPTGFSRCRARQGQTLAVARAAAASAGGTALSDQRHPSVPDSATPSLQVFGVDAFAYGWYVRYPSRPSLAATMPHQPTGTASDAGDAPDDPNLRPPNNRPGDGGRTHRWSLPTEHAPCSHPAGLPVIQKPMLRPPPSQHQDGGRPHWCRPRRLVILPHRSTSIDHPPRPEPSPASSPASSAAQWPGAEFVTE